MAIECNNCHAGVTALEWFVEVLQSGVKQQVVRCTLCGWRVQRWDPSQEMTREFKRREKKIKQPAKQHQEKTAPCTVVGCDAMYAPMHSKRNMCKVHSKIMSQWIYCGMKTEPPYLQRGDVWIENVNRGKKKGQAA